MSRPVVLRTFVVALMGLSAAAPAFAGLLIEDSVTLATTGQSMWESGPESVFARETFLGTKWGTYAGDDPARLELGTIVGDEHTQVPLTGGTIPNPVRIAWDGAMAACQVVSSYNTCVNGTSAVRACAPSWLGGGCTTIVPAIPGLGNPPPAEIDNPVAAQFIDTRTGLQGGIESSGEAGIIPWVEASGGGIDVQLGFDATIEIPDVINVGEQFTLTSSINVLASETSITATAPSFKAGVDGIFNTENDLFGQACIVTQGCAVGEVPIDVKAGRFGIVSIDTSEDNFLRVGGGAKGVNSLGVPGIGFDTEYVFYVPTPENPDGVDDETTPKKVPSPRLGDFMISNPQDLTGGVVSNNQVDFTTNQQLLSLNASITGLGELAIGSPGVLSNKVEIAGPVSLQYTFLDIAAGPRIGMQQDFSLDPNARVKLEFDKPVILQGPPQVTYVTIPVQTQVCISQYFGICFQYGTVTKYVSVPQTVPGQEITTNIVDMALGDSVNLRFAGEIGNLIGREYYIEDAQFSNRTGATIDPGLKVQVGCITALGLGGCLYNEDFKTEGLININVFDETWALGGFNKVAFLDTILTNPGGTPGSGGGGSTTAVPEPHPLLLLGTGLLLLTWRMRRRDLRSSR
ncbi:MAG: hypothetical protein R3E86_14470 [Pseudomonadales bacterium]